MATLPHPAAQCDMLLRENRNSVAGAAAAAAAIRTLEHGSRATQEFPVCKGTVNENLVHFLLSVHFLGMNQLDFCS